jgi:HSP90 family molecular chaperone
MAPKASEASILNGFDPLAERTDMDDQDRGVFEEATQRVVQNILKSYTGYWDLFSELIQNSLDAIEQKKRTDTSYVGALKIDIDYQTRTVAVSDNGIGMGLRELRYCFRPSVIPSLCD